MSRLAIPQRPSFTYIMLVILLGVAPCIPYPARADMPKQGGTKTPVTIPSLDPTIGLPIPPAVRRLNAISILRSGRTPPFAIYMRHLYFQPLRVTVMHDPRTFVGLSHLVGRLTEPTRQRPGYLGECPLLPAHRVSLTVTPSGHGPSPEILISFGQEVAGRIEMRGTGGTVLVGTGESRGEAIHQPWKGIDRLKLRQRHNSATPYCGFRYATITFQGPGPIHITRLRLDFNYYPVQYRGSFRCSDAELTRIWYTGAYTVHLCMQEELWDGVKRDRAMWMGDMQVSGHVVDDVFMDHFLMELTMGLLRRRAQGDILPPGMPMGGEWHHARFFNRPDSGPPVRDVNAIPGYSCAWICALYDYYLHTGDIRFLQSNNGLVYTFNSFLAWLANAGHSILNRHDEWNFVDWAPGLGGGKSRDAATDTPEAQTNTDLFTCWALKRAVRLLRVLHDNTHATLYAHWHHQLVVAARAYLVDHHTHTYTQLPQPNAMAVISGVATPAQRAAIWQHIFGPGHHFWKKIGTPYCMYFALKALDRLKGRHRAFMLVRRYWGGMLGEGATTFWEAYRMSLPHRHTFRTLGYFTSLCHGWAAGATTWLTQYALGVRPTGGGFTKTTIIPHPGRIKMLSGQVPTPHGNIRVYLRQHANRVTYRVFIPEGIDAIMGVRGRALVIHGPTRTATNSAGRSYFRLRSGMNQLTTVGIPIRRAK